MSYLSFDREECHFQRWQEYEDFECLLIDSVDDGLEILVEAERCEPFQNFYSIYAEQYIRCGFMKAMVKEATKKYPLLMARAMKKFLEQ